MSPRLSEKDGSAKGLLQTLKQSLSVDALKSLLTKRQGNAGRERYRRAGLTASASFISKALTIVISFVSVPLTVNYLGPERYGVWLTIGSLLTWMSMTDFGIAGNALVNLLADAHGKEDKRLAGQHASSAFWTLVGFELVHRGHFPVHFSHDSVAGGISCFFRCAGRRVGKCVRLFADLFRSRFSFEHGQLGLRRIPGRLHVQYLEYCG